MQTNSTVTATIPQQISGASFFDWIINALFQTTVTDWIMVAVTVALAYYAYKTIDEAKKDRRVDSIERQLEKLYGPMFAILDRAKPHQETPYDPESLRAQIGPLVFGNLEAGKYHFVSSRDDRTLCNILANYGHYLDQSEYDKVRQLLSQAETLSSKGESENTYYLDTNYSECLDFIRAHRTQLTVELYKLTGGKEP